MGNNLESLDKNTLISMFFDSLHLTILHYGLWFRETEYQIGLDNAIEADVIVWDRIIAATVGRIARKLKVPTKSGTLQVLADASKEDLVGLLGEMGKNWLAADGVWFQTVEQNHDGEDEMYTAKRINDTCWTRFSYIEAKIIMKRLGIPENGGIPALQKVMENRQYARINQQEIELVGDNKLIIRMGDCRVQTARKRQGMTDYPCKSAGVVEYRRLAEAVDSRFVMRCIGCPPDPHPEEWWCAWEFELR